MIIQLKLILQSKLLTKIPRFQPHRTICKRSLSTQNETIPSIIIGGGPTGLFLSHLLTSYSIPHLLFEKRSKQEVMRHPQAHFINLRSMELLRHEVPNVYKKILEGMPSVEEWEGFHFGGCVYGGGGRRLGRVVHPVRGALGVGQRGDALLVDNEAIANDYRKDATEDRVSPCQPGHLAQNKFVSLLLDEAQANNARNLHYNTEVTKITQNNSTITIQTSTNQSYTTHYLLACDGVHSPTRQQCSIPMTGENAIQHMMNIHFRTNNSLSKLLMEQDAAMLHFVYNPKLVGAFVCHDGHAGEWVLQIPYFPPYQVPEVDFTLEKVREMIWSGLMGQTETNTNGCDFDILSIRPWTMSSQVAQRYMNQFNNVLLVGDAAHAFPPAGGFGMNTGLQDGHNLAWRLAMALNCSQNQTLNDSDVVSSNSILSKYEQDRQPIATQNAALSMRNYQRTLRIAKACYLDANHPQLLMGVLASLPLSLLPLEMRRDVFRRLVQVAMMPLGSLLRRDDSLHADRVEKNVRKILESGGSLPLVFPRYELGFCYDSGNEVSDDYGGDSAGYYPKIRVGYRLPHVEMEVVTTDERDRWSILETLHLGTSNCPPQEEKVIHTSLVDISSQLRRVHSLSTPIFSLLVLGSDLINSSTAVQKAADNVKTKWKVPLILVNVLYEKPKETNIQTMQSTDPTCKHNESPVEYFLDVHQTLYKYTQRDLLPDSDVNCHERDDTSFERLNAMIMVRPDGHIAHVSYIDVNEDLEICVGAFIEQGFHNSLGTID